MYKHLKIKSSYLKYLEVNNFVLTNLHKNKIVYGKVAVKRKNKVKEIIYSI